jgi:putative oxidoreductase
MDRDFFLRQRTALIFLRVVVAVLMIIHGAARIRLGIVDDFGGFLTANGFPFGLYAAWGITVFEILGGLLLASGYYAFIVGIIFIIELIFGIVLVHQKEGWFVVGAGKNGMEYSVLLITALTAIVFSHYGGDGTRSRR